MSENTGSVGKRTVASGAVIFAANIYAVWASQIYQADDAPYFKRGNSINIAFAGFTTILWVVQKYYYRRLNASNARKYAALTEQEKREEDSQADKKGNRSLTFKYTT